MKEKLLLDMSKASTVCTPWPPLDTTGTLLQVQFAGHEYLGPSYYVHREQFESYLLCFTTQGHTNILFNNKLYCAGENTVIFYDCLHNFTSTTDTRPAPDAPCAEIYYIHLYPNDLIKQFCKSVMHDEPVLHLDGDTVGFCALCNNLLRDLTQGTMDELAYSVRIYELLCKLRREVGSNSHTVITPDPVQKVLHYIAKHYSAPLPIRKCAEIVSLSPNYLETLFTTHVGMPIATYLADVRFQKSTELLLNTDLSLNEIAEQVGLADSRALIRLYRKKVDMTPLSYRKYYRRTHPSPPKP